MSARVRKFIEEQTCHYTELQVTTQREVTHKRESLRSDLLEGKLPNRTAFMEEIPESSSLVAIDNILKILGGLDEANPMDGLNLAISYMEAEKANLKRELGELASSYLDEGRAPSTQWLRCVGRLKVWAIFCLTFGEVLVQEQIETMTPSMAST